MLEVDINGVPPSGRVQYLCGFDGDGSTVWDGRIVIDKARMDARINDLGGNGAVQIVGFPREALGWTVVG